METLLQILVVTPPLMVAVIVHEIAHGLTAEKLGDPTARMNGRITLNPIKHIDPILTILMPAALILAGSPIIFGGAKPVPVDPRYFKNPRRDMSLVAIAGPISNIILAAISFLLILGFNLFSTEGKSAGMLGDYVYSLLVFSVLINVVLCCFNLFPVPPLDGGRIAVGLLPRKAAYALARLEPFGFAIVIALLYFGVIGGVLDPIVEFTLSAMGIK